MDIKNTVREPIPYEERVAMLQMGTIDYLQYVMNGEHARDYLEWCRDHNCQPDASSAELFTEMVEIDMIEHQFIDDEYYGIWN